MSKSIKRTYETIERETIQADGVIIRERFFYFIPPTSTVAMRNVVRDNALCMAYENVFEWELKEVVV